jgi:hypothetical protein
MALLFWAKEKPCKSRAQPSHSVSFFTYPDYSINHILCLFIKAWIFLDNSGQPFIWFWIFLWFRGIFLISVDKYCQKIL